MYHVISKMESLIDLLEQCKHKKLNLNWQENSEWPAFSTADSDTLKEQLLTDVLSYTTEDALKVYVSNMQAMLTTLLDKLYIIELEINSSSNVEIDAGLHAVIAVLRQRAEKGFLFLEQSFKQHYDKTQNIPYYLQDKHKPALLQAVQSIHVLQKPEQNELINMVIEPVEKFINENQIQLSYEELFYYEGLLKDINKILFKTPGSVHEKELSKVLIQMNFNDAAFFEYYIRHIKMKIQNVTDDDLKIKELSSQEKYIKQLIVHADIACRKSLPSIQSQLVTWIEEEINFIKNTSSIQQPSSQPTAHKPDDKIHLSVSVNVLGFLLKLFVAGGIITNTNQSDVIRFFSKHCKTSRQEDISFDSLYNKYHQPNSSTIKITKELFINLMQLISKLS